MRNTPNLRIEKYRRMHPVRGYSPPGENYGYFEINRMDGTLRIIASDGTEPEEQGWEHVSVSRPNRIPDWKDMQFVKELFWDDEETVLQFHPAKSQYVNFHPYVLHLWRRRGAKQELPPRSLIA